MPVSYTHLDVYKRQSMINAAKQKLLLLGMSLHQLNHIAATRKPQLTVGIFSNYSGYVRDASNSTMSSATNTRINALPNTTAPLSAVSYTHLDVYKRQLYGSIQCGFMEKTGWHEWHGCFRTLCRTNVSK